MMIDRVIMSGMGLLLLGTVALSMQNAQELHELRIEAAKANKPRPVVRHVIITPDMEVALAFR